MKKFVIVSILLIIIVLSFGFVSLTIQARGSEDNYFNRNWREDFAAIPFFRQALGLHFDGDAKADYLGSRYERIIIEVDIMDGYDVEVASLDILKDKIGQITGKQTQYLISDRNILQENDLTRERIKELVKTYMNHKSGRDTAVIYLLYANQLADEPQTLAITHQGYGIILFNEALKNFTQNSPTTFPYYSASSALHEFGHQVGLPHNDKPDCLMNEHAEEAHVAAQDPEDVIIDFCEFEKNQIVNYGQ